MNKERREKIQKLIDKANDIRTQVETLRDEEQEYKDNMPENMQSGQKGDDADTAIQALEEACSALETVETSLEEAVNV